MRELITFEDQEMEVRISFDRGVRASAHLIQSTHDDHDAPG